MEYVKETIREGEKKEVVTGKGNRSKKIENYSMSQAAETKKESVCGIEGDKTTKQPLIQVQTVTRSGRKTKIPDRFHC